jgi:ATP-dependent Clp endopeptidase proteolytic subunit ClpP
MRTYRAPIERTGTIDLFGEIGDGALVRFRDQFEKFGHRPGHLRINSPGGSVVEGVGIANLIAQHKPGVSCEIMGLAGSMATVIASYCTPVSMASNAMFMIHNPSIGFEGDARELRRLAKVLDQWQKILVGAYVRRTKLPESDIQKMMDAETWLTAEQAHAFGFVDKILPPSPTASASIRAAAHRYPKLAATLAKTLPTKRTGIDHPALRLSKTQGLQLSRPLSHSAIYARRIADEYRAMPAGAARDAFYEKNKWELWNARRFFPAGLSK